MSLWPAVPRCFVTARFTGRAILGLLQSWNPFSDLYPNVPAWTLSAMAFSWVLFPWLQAEV